MKRPFDAICELCLRAINKQKEIEIFNFEQPDKILVWLIGFSIAAISSNYIGFH